MRRLEAAELKNYLDHSESPPLLLDVRQPWEYDICSLSNAQLIPMSEIPTKLDELDRDQEIVVICHHGIRSLRVATYLESAGFKKVINLDGGVNAWAQQVDTTMATY